MTVRWLDKHLLTVGWVCGMLAGLGLVEFMR